jgi:hypothetical protein
MKSETISIPVDTDVVHVEQRRSGRTERASLVVNKSPNRWEELVQQDPPDNDEIMRKVTNDQLCVRRSLHCEVMKDNDSALEGSLYASKKHTSLHYL